MKITKETHESIEDVLLLLQKEFPAAYLKKPLIGKAFIMVPYDNFEFFLRDKKTYLIVDFLLPKGQRFTGAALFGALGLIIWKAIFKKKRKAQIQDFMSRAELAINKIGTIGSIGHDFA